VTLLKSWRRTISSATSLPSRHHAYALQVPWLYQRVNIPLLYTRSCTSPAPSRPRPPAALLLFLLGLAVLAAAGAGGRGRAVAQVRAPSGSSRDSDALGQTRMDLSRL
jgi:hypothetical protein